MELLRCVAMMMIVVLHYLGKGGLLADVTGQTSDLFRIAAWIPEALSMVAVNLYMLLSGYFGWKSSFRLSRLIRSYLQIWFYSAVIGMMAFVVWGYPQDTSGTYFFLILLFPVAMKHYWFMTAYIFLYLLLPVLNPVLRRLNRKQFGVAAVLLFFAFCLVKSVLLVRLEMDQKGYSVLWYLCLYVCGAYMGRFGNFDEEGAEGSLKRAIVRRKGICIYFAGTLGCLAELFLLNRIYIRTGKLSGMINVSTDYNHFFVFAASVGLFLCFANLRVEGVIANVIIKIAPYTLGGYLLHENVVVRYLWPKWLGTERVTNISTLFLHLICAVIAVFITGVFTDFLRAALEKAVHRGLGKIPLYRLLTEKIQQLDEIMREEMTSGSR